jgi:hypothetical protein
LPLPHEEEGIVRAHLHLGGFFIKQIQKSTCYLTVLGEADFKIAQFMQKNVGQKAGNYAQMVSEYAALNLAKGNSNSN